MILSVVEQAVKLPTATSNSKTDTIVLHLRRRAGMPKSRQNASTALPVPAHLPAFPPVLLPSVTPSGSLVPLPKISINGVALPPAVTSAEAGYIPHSAGVAVVTLLVSTQV